MSPRGTTPRLAAQLAALAALLPCSAPGAEVPRLFVSAGDEALCGEVLEALTGNAEVLAPAGCGFAEADRREARASGDFALHLEANEGAEGVELRAERWTGRHSPLGGALARSARSEQEWLARLRSALDEVLGSLIAGEPLEETGPSVRIAHEVRTRLGTARGLTRRGDEERVLLLLTLEDKR